MKVITIVMKCDGLEYRQALCCWTLTFTATPDNVAKTNMAMHNASVTQNGPNSVTMLRNRFSTNFPADNNLENKGETQGLHDGN